MRGKRERPEKKLVQDPLIEFLEGRDWLVEPTHGNAYQKGFPDLFLAHVRHGQRWVDCKVKGQYSFTKAQKDKWPQWEKKGVGIWILTAANQEEYDKLFLPPNWRDFWRASYGDLPDIDEMLRELQRESNGPSDEKEQVGMPPVLDGHGVEGDTGDIDWSNWPRWK